MKRHIASWVIALGFVAAGFTVAACDPVDKTPAPAQTLCLKDHKQVKC